jgi:hypothetical protein
MDLYENYNKIKHRWKNNTNNTRTNIDYYKYLSKFAASN